MTYNVSDNSMWFLLWRVDCGPIKLYYDALAAGIYKKLWKNILDKGMQMDMEKQNRKNNEARQNT